MDRTIVKRTTLDQQGRDSGVPNATPAERLMMVWPLTLAEWAFKEPNIVQPRLQRHVVCIVRSLLSPLPGLWWIEITVAVGFTHGYMLPPLPWVNRSSASCIYHTEKHCDFR
jgi:hypothetical protein